MKNNGLGKLDLLLFCKKKLKGADQIEVKQNLVKSRLLKTLPLKVKNTGKK